MHGTPILTSLGPVPHFHDYDMSSALADGGHAVKFMAGDDEAVSLLQIMAAPTAVAFPCQKTPIVEVNARLREHDNHRVARPLVEVAFFSEPATFCVLVVLDNACGKGGLPRSPARFISVHRLYDAHHLLEQLGGLFLDAAVCV